MYDMNAESELSYLQRSIATKLLHDVMHSNASKNVIYGVFFVIIMGLLLLRRKVTKKEGDTETDTCKKWHVFRLFDFYNKNVRVAHKNHPHLP